MWRVCAFESPRSSLNKRRIFRKSTRPSLPLRKAPPFTPTLFNGLYTPFGSPVCGGTETSGAREKTALLGARNRFAIRLADQSGLRHILRDGTALLKVDRIIEVLVLW